MMVAANACYTKRKTKLCYQIDNKANRGPCRVASGGGFESWHKVLVTLSLSADVKI